MIHQYLKHYNNIKLILLIFYKNKKKLIQSHQQLNKKIKRRIKKRKKRKAKYKINLKLKDLNHNK